MKFPLFRSSFLDEDETNPTEDLDLAHPIRVVDNVIELVSNTKDGSGIPIVLPMSRCINGWWLLHAQYVTRGDVTGWVLVGDEHTLKTHVHKLKQFQAHKQLLFAVKLKSTNVDVSTIPKPVFDAVRNVVDAYRSGGNASQAAYVFTTQAPVPIHIDDSGSMAQRHVYKVVHASSVDAMQKALAGNDMRASGYNDPISAFYHLMELLPFVNETFTVKCKEFYRYEDFSERVTHTYDIHHILLSTYHLYDDGTLPKLNGKDTITDATLLTLDDNRSNEQTKWVQRGAEYNVYDDSRFVVMWAQIMQLGNTLQKRFATRITGVRSNITFLSHNGQDVDFRLIGIVYAVYNVIDDNYKVSHYVAHARRNGRWWLFDDAYFEAVDESSVLMCQTNGKYVRPSGSTPTVPYLLFYAREKDNSLPPVGLANPAVACYFSALMQCLMPAFMHAHRSGWM